LSPYSATNTKIVMFISYPHSQQSPFYDALDWTWESISRIDHRLWAG
jgi:hypothetical protein